MGPYHPALTVIYFDGGEAAARDDIIICKGS